MLGLNAKAEVRDGQACEIGEDRHAESDRTSDFMLASPWLFPFPNA